MASLVVRYVSSLAEADAGHWFLDQESSWNLRPEKEHCFYDDY